MDAATHTESGGPHTAPPGGQVDSVTPSDIVPPIHQVAPLPPQAAVLTNEDLVRRLVLYTRSSRDFKALVNVGVRPVARQAYKMIFRQWLAYNVGPEVLDMVNKTLLENLDQVSHLQMSIMILCGSFSNGLSLLSMTCIFTGKMLSQDCEERDLRDTYDSKITEIRATTGHLASALRRLANLAVTAEYAHEMDSFMTPIEHVSGKPMNLSPAQYVCVLWRSLWETTR